jgi:hypothetical protein
VWDAGLLDVGSGSRDLLSHDLIERHDFDFRLAAVNLDRARDLYFLALKTQELGSLGNRRVFRHPTGEGPFRVSRTEVQKRIAVSAGEQLDNCSLNRNPLANMLGGLSVWDNCCDLSRSGTNKPEGQQNGQKQRSKHRFETW